jgi:hypothetical protein
LQAGWTKYLIFLFTNIAAVRLCCWRAEGFSGFNEWLDVVANMHMLHASIDHRFFDVGLSAEVHAIAVLVLKDKP